MAGALGSAVRGSKLLNPVTLGHASGLFVGSLVMALGVSLTGNVVSALGLRPVAELLVVVACAIALLQVAGGRPLQSSWQVPESWRRSIDPTLLATFYGFLLGFGVLTAVVASAFWVFVTLSLVVSPVIVIAGWTAYAIARVIGFVAMARASNFEMMLATLNRNSIVRLATAAAIIASASMVS